MKRRQLEPWDYKSSEQYNSSLDAIGICLFGFVGIILILMMVSKCKSPDQPKVNKAVVTEYKEKYAVDITDGKRKYLNHLFNTQE
jgi:amino acid permease